MGEGDQPAAVAREPQGRPSGVAPLQPGPALGPLGVLLPSPGAPDDERHCAHRDKDDGQQTIGYPSRDYAKMENMSRDFLARHPKSRKRETALFVLARSVQALSRPYILAVYQKSADAPGGGAEALKSYQIEPFDAKRVMETLDACDREFPNGRYAADIRNYPQPVD